MSFSTFNARLVKKDLCPPIKTEKSAWNTSLVKNQVKIDRHRYFMDVLKVSFGTVENLIFLSRNQTNWNGIFYCSSAKYSWSIVFYRKENLIVVYRHLHNPNIVSTYRTFNLIDSIYYMTWTLRILFNILRIWCI